MYWFSCAIDGSVDDHSRADYVSFWNLGYWEVDPVGDQTYTYASLSSKLMDANVPTWYQMYGVSDEADYVEYELRPELLNDTFYLYNSSSQLIRPYGAMTGGARFTWTNTNIGWKVPISNWGLVNILPDGNVELTPNYERLQQIFDGFHTGNWLSDRTIRDVYGGPERCDAKAMPNTTVETYHNEGELSVISLATDWALPTRPAGLEELIASGAGGQTGKMVDVTVTLIAQTVRSSNGSEVTGLKLKPTKSYPITSKRTVAPTSTGLAGKMGVGIGAAAGGLAFAVFGGGTLDV